MRNKYETRGKVTAILLNSRKLGKQEALIDTEDLSKLLELDVKWYPSQKNSKRSIYVVANTKKDDGNSTLLSLHRVVMNPDNDLVVDHVNHNGLDNRRENLRIVTVAENNQNLRGARRNSALGIRGVSYEPYRNKYRAHVVAEGKSVVNHRYDTLEEAVEAAQEARKRYMKYATN